MRVATHLPWLFPLYQPAVVVSISRQSDNLHLPRFALCRWPADLSVGTV